jgi:hypothetical protein
MELSTGPNGPQRTHQSQIGDQRSEGVNLLLGCPRTRYTTSGSRYIYVASYDPHAPERKRPGLNGLAWAPLNPPRGFSLSPHGLSAPLSQGRHRALCAPAPLVGSNRLLAAFRQNLVLMPTKSLRKETRAESTRNPNPIECSRADYLHRSKCRQINLFVRLIL